MIDSTHIKAHRTASDGKGGIKISYSEQANPEATLQLQQKSLQGKARNRKCILLIK
jgi:hypothetical protein